MLTLKAVVENDHFFKERTPKAQFVEFKTIKVKNLRTAISWPRKPIPKATLRGRLEVLYAVFFAPSR